MDPNQPRETYHGIDSLAESMVASGFKENEAVTAWYHPDLEIPEGEAQVADGHRRTKGAMQAKLSEIPAFIYDLSDMPFEKAKAFIWEIQLVGNANREDLSTMNRARSFRRSIDEHDMSIGRVAKIHGVSVALIKADLELCDLSPELHKFVDDGSLPKEVARKLATSGKIVDPDKDDENGEPKFVPWASGEQVYVFNHCVKGDGVKTAKDMLAAIQAYIDKQSQKNLFADAKKKAAEAGSGGLSKARKASEKLEKAIITYDKKWTADLNVINSRKRDLEKLKMTMKTMQKIADRTLAQIRDHEAMQKMNAPKKEAVAV